MDVSDHGLDFSFMADTPDLLGLKEVAELLGVDKSRIGRWRRRGYVALPSGLQVVSRAGDRAGCYAGVAGAGRAPAEGQTYGYRPVDIHDRYN